MRHSHGICKPKIYSMTVKYYMSKLFLIELTYWFVFKLIRPKLTLRLWFDKLPFCCRFWWQGHLAGNIVFLWHCDFWHASYPIILWNKHRDPKAMWFTGPRRTVIHIPCYSYCLNSLCTIIIQKFKYILFQNIM